MGKRRLLAALAAAAVTAAPAVAIVTVARPAVAATQLTYTYEVRGLGNRSSLDTFAALAAQTYADGRGWSLGGSIAFRRVSSGGNFTLWLAAAGNVPGFGAPCDSGFSCTIGRNVVINETRWLTASPSWNAVHASLRDYRNMVVNHETGHWLGFGHALCGGAGQLAPVMQQQSISLQGCRPNPWPLPSERQRLASSRGVPIITGSPFGAFDTAAPGLGSVRVRGWTIDPNTTGPGQVHIYVDSHGSSVTANKYRPDVALRFPAYGRYHGYDVMLRAAPGAHRVCVYSVNVAGPGRTTALGCRSVSVTGMPTGRVDRATVAPSSVRITGWAIDPDTTGPTKALVRLDAGILFVTADVTRADVAARFPFFGARHGFDVTISATPGQHSVCVWAVNIAGSGHTFGIGCQAVTVPT